MRTAHAGFLSDTTHYPMVTSDANSACWISIGHSTLSGGDVRVCRRSVPDGELGPVGLRVVHRGCVEFEHDD